MDPSTDPHFQDFIKSRNLRKSTIIEYEKVIKQYCTFLNKNPTELIEEAEAEEDNHIRMKNRKIKKHLLSYHQHIQDRGLKYLTIKKQLAVIRTFYNEYEIELPRIRISEPPPTREMTSDLPGKDEIRLVLRNCNKKYQSIILLMVSSGMGRAEALNLKIKTFFSAINYTGHIGEIGEVLDRNDSDLICCWKISRFKTSMPYVTFSSPESSKYIIDYLLSERQEANHDEYLFISLQNNHISNPAFENQFQKINCRCGFGKTGYHHFFRSHLLRKYFASVLIRCRIQQIYIDWMLGHRINKVTESYFKADLKALKSEYLKALPELTITENLESIVVTDGHTHYYNYHDKYISFVISRYHRVLSRTNQNKRVSNHIRNQSLKKAYFEFVNSVNKCLFCSLKSLTASFHALFIGSLSNFNRARVLKTFRSCVNTVADVLVSSSFTFTKTTFAPPMFLCSYISSFNNIIFSLFYVLCAKESNTQSIYTMKNNLNMTKNFQFFCQGIFPFF